MYEDDELWTIELNLDRDFASASSYHIAALSRTISSNIQHAEERRKTHRWALVGLAHNAEEAGNQAHELRMLLCKKHGKEPS
jgi:hypothetical protein